MERPILFSGDMVRAILAGRKTQTRRVKFKCGPGDVLWVRETFNCLKLPIMEKTEYWHKADDNPKRPNPDDKWKPAIFMPRAACRLFLRVKAVREERLQDISNKDCMSEGLYEDLMQVKCELQLLNDDCNLTSKRDLGKTSDCAGCRYNKRETFKRLWDSLNAKRGYSWESNPIVKVIEFERKTA